jgi:hypothetical protein
MSQRSGARVILVSAILTLVVGLVGLIASLVLDAFFFDEYDAYGEVPIPGTRSLQLPAGEVTASFHTVVTGQPVAGLPVPNLHLSIFSPAGLPEVAVNEDWGASTTVNNDARVRVWVLQVKQAGKYQITTSGDVNGYISPRLAFGHGSSYGWLPWLFGATLVAGAVELTVALLLSARAAKKARPLTPEESSSVQVDDYQPSDQGVRIEQLKQLAALKDSGALTEDEFEAEKRRILEG